MSSSPEPLTRQIVETALTKGPVYWIFDWDGTLVELAATPTDIIVPPTLLTDLGRLADISDGRVAIVSGRSAMDLQKLVPVAGLTFVGNHGVEWRQSGKHWTEPILSEVQRDLAAALDPLRRLESQYPGSILEDKQYTISFHVRQVPTEQRNAIHVLLQQVVGALPSLALREADACWEIRPVNGPTKGLAVAKLLEHDAPRALIFGDDWTDEDAFAAAPPDSLTVIVGSRRPTRAHYHLDSPRLLRALLNAVVRDTLHPSGT